MIEKVGRIKIEVTLNPRTDIFGVSHLYWHKDETGKYTGTIVGIVSFSH